MSAFPGGPDGGRKQGREWGAAAGAGDRANACAGSWGAGAEKEAGGVAERRWPRLSGADISWTLVREMYERLRAFTRDRARKVCGTGRQRAGCADGVCYLLESGVHRMTARGEGNERGGDRRHLVVRARLLAPNREGAARTLFTERFKFTVRPHSAGAGRCTDRGRSALLGQAVVRGDPVRAE